MYMLIVGLVEKRVVPREVCTVCSERSKFKEATWKILEIETPSNQEQITYNCGLLSGGTYGLVRELHS